MLSRSHDLHDVDDAVLIKLLNISALMAIMLATGMTVRFAQVLESARRVRLMILAIVANFVLVPVITVGLLELFDPVPLVSVGFLILALCPGAPVGPPFATIARGDVPFAVGEMVFLSLLSALFTPILLGMLLAHRLPMIDLHIDSMAIVRILLFAQILPLVIGMSMLHGLPNFTSRIARPFRILANLMFLAVIMLILIRDFESLRVIRLRGWFGMLLLLSSSLGLGWLCGGPGRASRKTLALTTGGRNAAVALVIVSNNFADTPAVTAVVAYGLVSIFATLACAVGFAALPEAISPP